MPILDFQSLTLPVLSEFADGREHTAKEIRQRVAVHFGLTQEELAELLPPSERNALFRQSHCLGPRLFLDGGSAGCRATRRISHYDPWTRLLKTQPAKITVRVLSRSPEFTEFQARKSRSANT